MIDLTTLANALIALVAAVITAFVTPWIRSKTTAQQRTLLESVVKTLVFAAEQLYGAGNGADKLQYVRPAQGAGLHGRPGAHRGDRQGALWPLGR